MSRAQNATVSIALATYNGAAHLSSLLASLARQTLAPCEIVVTDDGSSDDTLRLLREFAACSSIQIRVFENKARLGYADNFLKAAALCRGEYVAFCDQDDEWLPEKLEVCVHQLEASSADLCGHEANIIDEHGAHIGYHRAGMLEGQHEPLTLPPWYLFFGFTIVFRRRLLEAAAALPRPPDQVNLENKLAHDRWLYFLGSTLSRTVYIARPLVNYRQHGGNAFGASGGATFQQKVAKLLTQYPDYIEKYTKLSRARLPLLRALSAQAGNPYAAAAAPAIDYWQKVVRFYELRGQLAQARSLWTRCALLAQLARTGAYRHYGAQGLGRQALYEDIVAACVVQSLTLQRALMVLTPLAARVRGGA